MARLFTIEFPYNERTYLAAVSVCTCNGTDIVSVFIPDTSLHHLLPEGRCSFEAAKGLPIDHLRISKAQHLLLAVFTAIETYHPEKSSMITQNRLK